ncbi:hypothetical protein [Pseudomonas sp. 22 E 5]|nr:hypothetical protein [Pseudomonas sp. 22 E 5]
MQHRVVMVLGHFVKQHAHGRQWCAQFVGGAGGLSGDGQQLLVAQAFFAANSAQFFLTAQFFGHACSEKRDHRSRQREAQPHPVDLQVFAGDGKGLQRIELRQQQGIERQRNSRQHHRVAPWQGHGGDGQWHQVIRNERVGGTTGEIKQHTVDKQVAGQLERIFQLGHRPRSAQTDGGERAQHRGKRQGHTQLQPRQRQQVEPIGKPDGAGLCGQYQGTDERQAPEVLACGGSQFYGGEHELSR